MKCKNCGQEIELGFEQGIQVWKHIKNKKVLCHPEWTLFASKYAQPPEDAYL